MIRVGQQKKKKAFGCSPSPSCVSSNIYFAGLPWNMKRFTTEEKAAVHNFLNDIMMEEMLQEGKKVLCMGGCGGTHHIIY